MEETKDVREVGLISVAIEQLKGSLLGCTQVFENNRAYFEIIPNPEAPLLRRAQNRALVGPDSVPHQIQFLLSLSFSKHLPCDGVDHSDVLSLEQIECENLLEQLL